MVIFILRYLFLFVTGGMLGWILEVFYRRYFGGARKWINPGFLSGPFLPLYGTGICLLYLVSDLEIHFAIKVILFAIVTTLIEYFTGLFFLKYYKTRLWDYSSLKFNVQGLIAPLYSLYWTILSLFFYFVLYPYFYLQIDFLYSNLELSLFIGMILGILVVDMSHSFGIVKHMKAFAEAREDFVIIDYEQLKLELRERLEHISDEIEDRVNNVRKNLAKSKPNFILPFKGNYELLSQLKEHVKQKKHKENKNTPKH